MTKLKTLKDFGKEGAIVNGEQIKFYDNFELKHEAIKWIKHLELSAKEHGCTNPDFPDEITDEQAYWGYYNSAQTFKEFFNINGEDVKWETQ